MSDHDNADSSFWTFFEKISAPIIFVISFIPSVYGLVKLFADKDTGLINLITLCVGILLLLSVFLYYARFWKPEQQDKGRSLIDLALSDERVKVQERKEKQRKWVRRLAVAGLILIPILCGSGFAGWQYTQSLPPKDIIVLVADFDSPDSKTSGMTEKVISQLRQATGKYSDVKIQSLKKSITEQEGSEVARNEGEKRKATIVIWGWLRNTGTVVPHSVHFEVLRPPKELPELGQTAKGQVQQAVTADLKSFTLQTRLSNEMSYLSLFTVGMTRYAAADWDGAITRFSDAIEQVNKPITALDQSIVYLYRGISYGYKGDYDQAITDFNQAIKLRPDFAAAYSGRGVSYSYKGDYDQAITDFNQAIKLRPDFAAAYNNRGNVYRDKGDYEQAITDFNQAIKLRSDFAEAYNNRGTAYSYQGDYDQAITDFNQAIKLKPDYANAYYNRGAIYRGDKGDYEQAITDFNQAIKLRPNFAEAYHDRGNIYRDKGDYEQAITDFNQAIKLKPDYANAYGNRGAAYGMQGDYDQAITDFNQVIKFNPNDGLAYLNRGKAFRQQGHKDKAVADFQKALKLAKKPKMRQDAEKQLRELGVK
jgi:tetratricopeptide (TPR) repeat protein